MVGRRRTRLCRRLAPLAQRTAEKRLVRARSDTGTPLRHLDVHMLCDVEHIPLGSQQTLKIPCVVLAGDEPRIVKELDMERDRGLDPFELILAQSSLPADDRLLTATVPDN
jgi:hypothetical protein